MIAQKMSYLQVVQILQELLMGLVSEAKFWVWWATICTTPNMWPVALRVEMAIKARPVGTRPGLILIDRILPDPTNNRIGYGLKKKKKPDQVHPIQTRPIYIILKKKNPRYKYSLSQFLPTDFISRILTLTLTLTLTSHSRPSLSHRGSHTLPPATYFCWSSNKPQYKSKSLLPSSSLIAVVVVIIFDSLLALHHHLHRKLTARLKRRRRSVEPLIDPISSLLQLAA